MMKRWLTRFLTVALVVILGYFFFLSSDREIIPIEKSKERQSSLGVETVRGEGVRYRSFDLEGNELVSGSSEKLTQIGEKQYHLEDGLELKFTKDGKKFHVKADRFENDEKGRQVMYADSGSHIFLSLESGVTLETEGPLVYSSDGVFSTDALARFELGQGKGLCSGFVYKPEVFLRLEKDVLFHSFSAIGKLRILADSLELDNQKKKGSIRNGVMSSFSPDGLEETTLIANLLSLTYEGELNHFRFRAAEIEGKPASFHWAQGSLVSETFTICFDGFGQRVEELITSWDTQFHALTQDLYQLNGYCGPLSLEFDHSVPLELKSETPVILDGFKMDGSSFELRGESGLITHFVSGKAYSTRLFGTPTFFYEELEGKAGNLRVLHDEGKILVSAGASLLDVNKDTYIRGDEILLTGWDLKEKEVFAFRFVEVIYRLDVEQMIQSVGETFELRIPDDYMKISGSPAKVFQKNQYIEAQQVEFTQIEGEGFELYTKEDVVLKLDSDEGSVEIYAQQLKFSPDLLAVFEHVTRAELSNQGVLSCSRLEIQLKNNGEKKRMETLKARGQVVFQGYIPAKDGEAAQAFSCQADYLDYGVEESQIYFRGEGKDVIFIHPSGELRGRELTYNLNDGSMRVDSETHGITKTIVSIKEKKQK